MDKEQNVMEFNAMGNYTMIKDTFWTDADVSEFTPDEKLFYLYSIANLHKSKCGCYEITPKQIAFEIGWDIQKAESILEGFAERENKIAYDKDTHEIFVRNFPKHNWSTSPKLDKPLLNDILRVKNTEFRMELLERYNERIAQRDGGQAVVSNDAEEYSFDSSPTVAQDSEEQVHIVPVTKTGAGRVPYEKICNLWNQICVSFPTLRGCEGKRKENVSARWKQHPDMEVFRAVFQNTEESNFLKGSNNRGWKASFDWVMLPSNFQKVLEGNYTNRTGTYGGSGDGWDFIKSYAKGGGDQ